MTDTDPHLARWAQEQREARQETNTHEAFGLTAGEAGKPKPGWGGVAVRSSNNTTGVQELDLDFRPVLLGFVEVRARLSTQPVGSEKPHAKKVCLHTTPTALRDLARQLLETADAADALKVKPRPVP